MHILNTKWIWMNEWAKNEIKIEIKSTGYFLSCCMCCWLACHFCLTFQYLFCRLIFKWEICFCSFFILFFIYVYFLFMIEEWKRRHRKNLLFVKSESFSHVGREEINKKCEKLKGIRFCYFVAKILSHKMCSVCEHLLSLLYR